MLHVLLDIDDTLLKNMKKEHWDLVPNKSDFQTEPSSATKIFVLRPHLDKFMKQLFENPQITVSLWTWSSHAQVTKVAAFLKRRQESQNPGKRAVFKDLLSEEDADISSTLHKAHGKDLNQLWQDYNQAFVDKFANQTGDSENIRRAKKAKVDLAKRNATVEEINEEREEVELEPFDTKPKKFFTDQAPCNTILVDDADYNQVVPSTRQNMIKIKPFGGHTESKETKDIAPKPDKNDVGLLKTMEILEGIDKSCPDEDAHPYPKGGPSAGKRKTRRGKKKAGTRRYRKRV